MQRIQNLRHTPLPEVLKNCFPPHLSDAIERCGAPMLEEVRLHSHRYTTITCRQKNYPTSVVLSPGDMSEILKRMCNGSLYAYSQSICQGFLTLRGGIRVGVCGKAALEKGQVIGIGEISGLMVRIPHKLSVSAKPVIDRLQKQLFLQGLLIYAPPGVGKTTLLRATAEQASAPPLSLRTVVVDTREEFCHTLEGEALHLDLLVGYPRHLGIEIAVRSLGAELILCDEIGSPADADAVLAAANCGVPLVASAHAACVEELLNRPSILRLHQAKIFGAYLGISRAEPGSFHIQVTDWNAAEKLLQAGKEKR